MALDEHVNDSDILEEIRSNTVGIEQLLGDILAELKKLNQLLQPAQVQNPFPAIPPMPQSGYACWKCGGWISSPMPHICNPIIW